MEISARDEQSQPPEQSLFRGGPERDWGADGIIRAAVLGLIMGFFLGNAIGMAMPRGPLKLVFDIPLGGDLCFAVSVWDAAAGALIGGTGGALVWIWTMNRRRGIWFVGILIVVIASQLWSLGVFYRRLAVKNYPLIRVGMSQDEVERLLGGPPGDYGNPIRDKTFHLICQKISARSHFWWDDSNRIEVHFDTEGRVRECYHAHFPPDGFFDWLRRFSGSGRF
jgi:hypothetical protein